MGRITPELLELELDELELLDELEDELDEELLELDDELLELDDELLELEDELLELDEELLALEDELDGEGLLGPLSEPPPPPPPELHAAKMKLSNKVAQRPFGIDLSSETMFCR